MTLEEFFSLHPKAAMGFSGGVDSAYLLYAGLKSGMDIRPYFIKTAFQPEFELEDARRLASELGAKLRIIEADILSIPHVAENPENRCYYCKRALFSLLKDAARSEGYDLLLDGTNASDDVSDRPGMQALKELSVLSPLREAGLTKDDIRSLSKAAGLFTWDKPAYACLATRIPSGETIDRETLSRVEKAERALYELGFSDLRVRIFSGAARLQLKTEQMGIAAEKAESIRTALSPYFDKVLLDLAGR